MPASPVNRFSKQLRQTLQCLAIVIVCAGASQSLAGEYPLWGNLRQGPHGVGFRSLWQLDYTRAYNMTFGDKTTYAIEKAPRPTLVNLWYPADPDAKAKPMLHRDYLEVVADDPTLRKFSIELGKYERAVVA